MLKRKYLQVIVAAVIGVGSGTAVAGYVWPIAVTLSDTAAYGNVSTARYSTDSNQEIGCEVSTAGVVACYAWDANNSLKMCDTTNSAWAPIVAGINMTSEVLFNFDSNAYCTSIKIKNDSAFVH